MKDVRFAPSAKMLFRIRFRRFSGLKTRPYLRTPFLFKTLSRIGTRFMRCTFGEEIMHSNGLSPAHFALNLFVGS